MGLALLWRAIAPALVFVLAASADIAAEAVYP
jgi:hypothetical protein